MKLTRLLSALLALCMVLSLLVACGSSGGTPVATSGNGGQRTTAASTIPQQPAQTTSAPQVANIFLSKSTLTLGVGETAGLIATVSPGNAEATLTWSSSDSSIAEVDSQGVITAKGVGEAVIKVEAPNGVLSVCNVTVKIKTGKVTGTITYKYNDYVGNKPDTGTIVYLISKSVTSLPYTVGIGMTTSLPEGCYAKKVDGTGSYTFDNMPVGEYYMVLISKNTCDNILQVTEETASRNWGYVYSLFDAKGKDDAFHLARLYRIRSTSISVKYGEVTTYSYDFGVTDF